MDELYNYLELVAIYDAINATREDFDFYTKQLPEFPARILDIGCGTGTFALDLARLGYCVVGVDPAPQMISAAERKDGANIVNWYTGFASDLPIDLRFDVVIMTGHAFQCLLEKEEIIKLFEAVAARLHAGGSFWFETRNAIAKPWLRWTPEYAKPPISLDNDRTVQVIHNVIEIKGDLVRFEEMYEFGDCESRIVSRSELRFLGLDEISRLARMMGLDVAEVYGNWSKEPFKSDSPEIIFRLVKRK